MQSAARALLTEIPKMSLDESILVVDDNRTIRNLLAERLRGEGFKVILARSGKEALARLETQTVDLAVLDIKMRDDGIETASRINELYPRVDIVFLTAFDNDTNRARASETGVRVLRWIDKEIDWLRNAQSTINQIVDRRRLIAYLKTRLAEVRSGYSDVASRYFSWNKFQDIIINHLWEAHEAIEDDKYRRQLADQLTQAIARIESHQLLLRQLDLIDMSLELLFSGNEISRRDIREYEKDWRLNRIETLPSFRRILAKWEDLYSAEEEYDEEENEKERLTSRNDDSA